MSQRNADGPESDQRDALELPASENADLCAGCTRCCETVSIEVDAPRAAWEYDQWVWVLHHRGLELYVEKPERWLLHIETRCEKLNDQGRCSIHGRHPVLCREYDPRACERRLPLADIVAWFHDADELEAWLKTSRPSHWNRLEAWRADKAETPPEPAPRNGHAVAQGLMQIGEAHRAGHEPATHLPARKRTLKHR